MKVVAHLPIGSHIESLVQCMIEVALRSGGPPFEVDLEKFEDRREVFRRVETMKAGDVFVGMLIDLPGEGVRTYIEAKDQLETLAGVLPAGAGAIIFDTIFFDSDRLSLNNLFGEKKIKLIGALVDNFEEVLSSMVQELSVSQ